MTVADILARTLRDAGVSRVFGLPGGEILRFVEAVRAAGIRFVLTRHEAHGAFMADATGQLTGIPGVCVSTLGPGAVNMTLGVANAFLDRSPVIAITAAHSTASAPYTTHQRLDLNAVYRPFSKATITLDGCDTQAKMEYVIALSTAVRPGPVHIALPSDIAAADDVACGTWRAPKIPRPPSVPSEDALERVHAEIRSARRPVTIVGNDVRNREDVAAVRAFVDAFGAPVFVTPKAKGIVPDDHRLFCGVCAGVSADAEVLSFFERADLIVGVGFDPVESDKIWHQHLRVVSVGPVSIAADEYEPQAECVGNLSGVLRAVEARGLGALDWSAQDLVQVRTDIADALAPVASRGLSGTQLTRCLRDLFRRDTVFLTDVGSVKMVTTQAWRCWEPGTFLESNGLSAMGYSVPAAIAVHLARPDRPVLCTVGDGGFAMTMGEIETCVREKLDLTIVIYNDGSLSLIDLAQQRRGYPTTGVRFAPVDFAAVARGLGAWSRRVNTCDELSAAVRDAPRHGPVVLDAVVDPAAYVRQTSGHQRAPRQSAPLL